jgi:hypothetical protein
MITAPAKDQAEAMKKSQELIRNTPLDRQKLKRAGSEKEPRLHLQREYSVAEQRIRRMTPPSAKKSHPRKKIQSSKIPSCKIVRLPANRAVFTLGVGREKLADERETRKTGHSNGSARPGAEGRPDG